MMEELSILLDEHQAMRHALGRLEEHLHAALADEPAGRRGLAAAVDALLELMAGIHNLKEETVLIHRLRQRDEVLEPRIRCNLSDKEAVVGMLRELQRGLCGPRPLDAAALEPGVRRVIRVTALMLKVEEEVLYPAVYRLCSEDDIWNMSVEMDRAVDMDGRERRARLIAATGLPQTSLLRPVAAA